MSSNTTTKDGSSSSGADTVMEEKQEKGEGGVFLPFLLIFRINSGRTFELIGQETS